MAESKKSDKKVEKKKPVKKSGLFKITKRNGRIIHRSDLGDYVKVYEAKGCKVEEV